MVRLQQLSESHFVNRIGWLRAAVLPVVSAASLAFRAFLGAIGARVGGADVLRGTARVIFWGALAMAFTAGIGKLLGTVV